MTRSNLIRVSALMLGAMFAVVAPVTAMPLRDATPSAPTDAAGRIVVSDAGAFSWPDAAVGAGAALAVVALALLALRRRSAHNQLERA